MSQFSANAYYSSDPLLDQAANFTIPLNLWDSVKKQKLMALHKNVYKSAPRDAAHERLLEILQCAYWSAILSAHMSTL
jgi:hypothetical protein